MMVSLSYMENLARYVLIFYLTLIHFYLFHESPQRKYSTVHAAIIKEFKIGYIDENQRIECPFPSYGINCNSQCSCEKKNCHHVHGCPQNTEDCPLGFFGTSCDQPCRYPNYGKDCQEKCKCSIEFCNNEFGCQEAFETTQTSDALLLTSLLHQTSDYDIQPNTTGHTFLTSPLVGGLTKKSSSFTQGFIHTFMDT
ncbi:cell death abnormality protein 1-like [Saccostrea cucullata]|uniref:cell death abnormality protein 1-like n=1 Tax=Saccostrea cuccullata TaxID=36930 RepID=UPI002ED60F5D